MTFEYKVVPAPTKGVKAKGVKTAEARFALAVEQAINELAADGWEYVRTDVLPSEERQGLTGSVTHWRNLMVFRRALVTEAVDAVVPERVEPVLTAAPVVAVAAPVTASVPEGPDATVDVEPEFEEGSEETRPT
jgi:hypothetical protein